MAPGYIGGLSYPPHFLDLLWHRTKTKTFNLTDVQLRTSSASPPPPDGATGDHSISIVRTRRANNASTPHPLPLPIRDNPLRPPPPLLWNTSGLLPASVQHENENFYLDVVELRTSAPLPPDDGDTSEWCNDGGKERTVDRSCGDDDQDGDSTGRGKRVQLVSLLGDLDLEVEFCPPRQRHVDGRLADFGDGREQKTSMQGVAAEGGNGEHCPTRALAAGETELGKQSARALAGALGHTSCDDVPAIISTRDRAAAEEGLRQSEPATIPLPAPATAKSGAPAGAETIRKASGE